MTIFSELYSRNWLFASMLQTNHLWKADSLRKRWQIGMGIIVSSHYMIYGHGWLSFNI